MTDAEIQDIRIHCNKSMRLEEGRILYDTASEIKAKCILEIGGGAGTSTSLLGTVAKENDGRLITVEPNPRQSWFDNLKRLGIEEYVECVQAESPWLRAGIEPIDYLCIDGSGIMRWVLVDYHYFAPFVRVGGRIAFHDWCGGVMYPHGVRRAVAVIMETDSKILKEIARNEDSPRQGIVVFEKVRECPFVGMEQMLKQQRKQLQSETCTEQGH